MTDTEFDPLDLNEDGIVSPMEELQGYVNELHTLQAGDWNFWQEQRLQRFVALLQSGIEGENFVFEPTVPTNPDSEFGPDGFSASGNFVQYEGMIEIANRWAESNNRLLEYAAYLIHRQRYMLPLARLEGDAEFQDRYAKNLDTAKNTFTLGRSGYKNQPVFERFISKDYEGRTFYVGDGVIPDHNFPYAGAHQLDIVEIVAADVESGAYRERYLLAAHNALCEMDRDNLAKWEGYREIPLAWRFDRNAELDNARNNPNY